MAEMIAVGRRRAYVRSMPVSRILRILTLLAVLLSPLAMVHAPATAASGPAAETVAAHHAASMLASAEAGTGDHCPDRDGDPASGRSAALDCAIACAALPATIDRLTLPPRLPALPAATPPCAGVHGLAPEADTPPPRLS